MMIAMIEADGMMGAATAAPAAQRYVCCTPIPLSPQKILTFAMLSVDTAAVVEILAIEIYTDAEIAR
jgi:hypothetical protein